MRKYAPVSTASECLRAEPTSPETSDAWLRAIGADTLFLGDFEIGSTQVWPDVAP